MLSDLAKCFIAIAKDILFSKVVVKTILSDPNVEHLTFNVGF